MKSYLFIGGVLDGQRVKIDSNIHQWRVPVPRGITSVFDQTYAANNDPVGVDHYVKTWLGPHQVFALNGDNYILKDTLVNRYPAAGTINVNLEDLETVLETCEPPFIAEGHARFDLAVRHLYAALANHRKHRHD
jgi:hypothetical protein